MLVIVVNPERGISRKPIPAPETPPDTDPILLDLALVRLCAGTFGSGSWDLLEFVGRYGVTSNCRVVEISGRARVPVGPWALGPWAPLSVASTEATRRLSVAATKATCTGTGRARDGRCAESLD